MQKTRKNKMKGGFETQYQNQNIMSNLSQNVSNVWSNISQSASNAWQKTKQSVQNGYNSISGNQSTQPTYIPSVGGKKLRKHKKMHGGYVANTCKQNIASNASSFSGKTAQPQIWVGGKTKKNNKTKKNIKSKRRYH